MKQSIVKNTVTPVLHRGKRYTRLTDAEMKRASAPSSVPIQQTDAQHNRREIASIIQYAANFISRLKQQP